MIKKSVFVVSLMMSFLLIGCGQEMVDNTAVNSVVETNEAEENIPVYVEEEKNVENDQASISEENEKKIVVLDDGYTSFSSMGDNLIVAFDFEKKLIIDLDGQQVADISELPVEYAKDMYNDDFFCIRNEDRWGVMAKDGSIKIEPEYDYINYTNGNIWDDGSFALIKYENDKYENVLFDKTATVIFDSTVLGEKYDDYFFSGFHEGILYLESTNNNPIYVDISKYKRENELAIIDLNEESWAKCYGSQNHDGIIVLKGNQVGDVAGEGRKGFNNYYDIIEEEIISLNNTEEGNLIATSATRLEDDGWLNGIVVDGENLDWNGDWFFYNINDDKLVEIDNSILPAGASICSINREKNINIHTFNNYGFISDGDKLVIVDLNKNGEIVNDEMYINISVENAGRYALVEKMDGTFDLLDVPTMTPTNKYVDATLFSRQGYAMVSEDGENFYIVDEKLNKISDDYQGVEGYLVGDLFGLMKADGTVMIISVE